MYICPVCKNKNIGKIGTSQYYCWSCFIEFGINGDVIELYEVEEDGSLSSLDDLFAREERLVSQHTYG